MQAMTQNDFAIILAGIIHYHGGTLTVPASMFSHFTGFNFNINIRSEENSVVFETEIHTSIN